MTIWIGSAAAREERVRAEQAKSTMVRTAMARTENCSRENLLLHAGCRKAADVVPTPFANARWARFRMGIQYDAATQSSTNLNNPILILKSERNQRIYTRDLLNIYKIQLPLSSIPSIALLWQDIRIWVEGLVTLWVLRLPEEVLSMADLTMQTLLL